MINILSTVSIFTVVLLIGISYGQFTVIDCGPNEVATNCAQLQICQPSCDNPNGTKCESTCSPTPCLCQDGFVRYSRNNLTCIQRTQCNGSSTVQPTCGVNEVATSCALLQECQPSCDNPNGTVCTLACSPNPCICQEGFVRDSRNNLTCIEKTQCIESTTAQPTCGPNEVAISCALLQACQPSCENPNGTKCESTCNSNPCVCQEGFVRDPKNNFTCIERTQCNTSTTENRSRCGPNEVADPCANPCQPSCQIPNQQPCPTITCSLGCVCSQGYLRATNDTASACVKCNS